MIFLMIALTCVFVLALFILGIIGLILYFIYCFFAGLCAGLRMQWRDRHLAK